MKKLLKVIALLSAALVAILAVVLIAFYRFVQIGDLRRFLVSEIERQTRLRVSVGEAELEMGKALGISFSDLVLMEPESERPVVTAQKAVVRMALLPLLERRMVFDEVRLLRPTVRIERDEQGRASLSGLLAYFPVAVQSEDRFTLDLREVKVEKGEMLFIGQRAEAGAAVTHLREVDVNLKRIQAGELARPKADLKAGTADGEGLALEFGLRAAFEGEGDAGGIRLTSKGRVLFPAGSSELRQAWWDAEGSVERLPASLLWAYYRPALPLQAIRGLLAPSLRWQGSAAGRLRIQGRIDFQRLELDAPDIFSGTLAAGDGRLELEIDRAPEELRVPRLEFRSAEIQLSAQGSARPLGEDDSFVEVHVATPFLPLAAARKYLPLKALDAPLLETLVKSMSQGELKLTKAGVSGPLSAIRRPFEPGSESNLWLDAELKDGGGSPPGDRYLAFKGVSGRVVLDKGVLYYRNFKGTYGLSRLTEVEGAQRGIASGRKSLDLRVKGEVDLAQLRQQLKAGWMPEAKAGDFLQELGGKGRLNLLVRAGPAGPPQFTGQLAVDNARVRAGDVSLAQVKGELVFSPKEIRAEKLTALLGGSPVLVRLLLSNYQSDRAAFDLAVDSSGVKAGEALRPFLSTASPQGPGMVRGRIQYRGPLADGAERSLSGALELIGVEMPFPFFRQPLREVRGRVLFDAGGFELQGMRAQLAGYPFDFSGRWKYTEKPGLTFALNFPEMDIAHLLPQDGRSDHDWYDRFQAKGRIRIGKGRFEGFEFSDLNSDLTLDRRTWRLENFSARSLGGTVQGAGRFSDGAAGLAFSIEPKVQGVPLDGFLKWFDMGTREIAGRIHLTGKLESRGATGAERKRNLTGNFQLEIRDGLARRLELLVRILNVMDLTRWFSLQVPDLTQKGIRFRSVTGDFKVKNGIYVTENLVVDSDDISITGAGQVDGPNEKIDAIIALRPFPRLGSVVSFIPLIGPGIAGIKDSVMVASFHVQGPVDDATITPAPLSTLSEFFFGALKIPQKLITIPGTGKK